MSKRREQLKAGRIVANEEGATLVELLVAMALLVSVLLPAGLFLGYVSHYPKNKETIYAAGMAQSAMESLIYEGDFEPRQHRKKLKPGWELVLTVTPNKRTVILQVRALRKGRTVVSFTTARLLHE